MSINPEKARFFVKIFLHKAFATRTSFDKAFRGLVRKYGITTHEASNLYRLLYKISMYYHSLKFIAGYKGFGVKIGGIVEYLYKQGFNMANVLAEIDDISRGFTEPIRIALKHGFPTWLVRDLYGKIPGYELEAMLKSLNERKRWLRVNTFKLEPSEAIGCLEKTGIPVKTHEYFNDILQVDDSFIKIGTNECVKSGLVIPEDISSYISVLVVQRYLDGSIDLIDMCSAPGIKLLHLLSTRRVKRAIGIDISEDRINEMKKILGAYLGIETNLMLLNADSRRIALNSRDSVMIIDAPCSNTGAIYGDPFVKMRLSRKRLKEFSMIQKSLLANAIKHKGLVVYMNCSIHPLEGEEVIDYIIQKYRGKVNLLEKYEIPFTSDGYSGYECTRKVYRIHPHISQGQGFFIAVLKTGQL